jgi:hypothetical protein
VETSNRIDNLAIGCLDDLVTVRRAASHIATMIVAVCIALAMPVSQLRMSYVVVTCCCPDPTNCHCPHEKPDPSKCPGMRPCHRTNHEIVMPSAPSFAPPEALVAAVQPRVTRVVFAAPRVPQSLPRPEEPYGPS